MERSCLNDDDLKDLEAFLCEKPEAGKLIKKLVVLESLDGNSRQKGIVEEQEFFMLILHTLKKYI